LLNLIFNDKYHFIIIYFYLRIYSLSTFLDPRYKDKFLLEDGQIFRAKIQSFIKEEIQAEVRGISPDPDVLFSPPVEIQAAPTKRKFSLLARMDKIAAAESSNSGLKYKMQLSKLTNKIIK
jgi:hypothetical protein